MESVMNYLIHKHFQKINLQFFLRTFCVHFSVPLSRKPQMIAMIKPQRKGHLSNNINDAGKGSNCIVQTIGIRVLVTFVLSLFRY